MRAQQLLTDSAATVRALAFVRVVAEVTAIASLTLVIAAWLDPWWQVLAAALTASILVALVAVRASPRSVARRHPATVLRTLASVLVPAVTATRWVSQSRPVAPEESERELADMVERVRESGAIEKEERELLRSVFELGNTLTREVMVPRTDMITTPRTTSLRKALTLFLRSGFSRIPVTGTGTDDLIGVCYFKDVVRVLQTAPEAENRPVSDVTRPAVFVPESKPVDDLLREMQSSASHIAMVVDEYGGIAGLVTIEDALEEIVGELTDEHDRPVSEPENLGDGRYRVSARLGVEEVGELFGRELDDEDVDTVGGLLAKALGKVPLPGSTATVSGLQLVAERVEGRRKQLATVLVSRAEDLDPTATDQVGAIDPKDDQ
jgi:CBS domain containing-hemolysin-like protein